MRKYKYNIKRDLLEEAFPKNILDKMNSERIYLNPYFKLKNGKDVLLQTLEILFNDTRNSYTVLKPKPGAFKTSKQEEINGNDYSPFPGKEFTVAEYRKGYNDYDLIGIQLISIFHDEDYFNIMYNFYSENYDKLKFNYSK